MRLIVVLLMSFCVTAAADQAVNGRVVKEIGSVVHGPLQEISGIVKSQSYPDTYWVHNDSGDAPGLFSITGKGDVIHPGFVRNKHIGEGDSEKHWQGVPVHLAANQDWEDIATHAGNIYIADVGNNGNARRDLGVYIVREPNPKAITNVRTLKYYPVEYPDQKSFPAEQWHFDSESMFVVDGVIYFVTKHRQPGKISQWEQGAKLYRLDTYKTEEVNTLTLVGEHDEVAVATGADVSPDGNYLAILCYTTIWLFEKPEQGDNWLTSKSHRLNLDFKQTGQVEAIAWQDDDQLIFTNEPGQLFTISRQVIVESD